jgi:integrase
MTVWKDKTYKYWVYQFRHLGRKYGERGFDTRRDAVAGESKRREDVTKQGKVTLAESGNTGFRKVAYEYLEIAERNYVKDVLNRKKVVFKRFIVTLPSVEYPIELITPQQVSAYLTTLPSNSQYNEHRHELSAFFNWVKRIYVRTLPQFFNPCLNVEAMTYVEKEKKPPTMEEVQRMIVAANPGDEKDLLIVCLQTLGRIDEIFRLRWMEDVNFEKRLIILWTRKRKNGKLEPDALPMNDDLYEILMHRWKTRKQDKWVFYDETKKDRYYDYRLSSMMANICKRAGIDPINHTQWHITRKKKNGEKRIELKEVDQYYGFHHLRHFMATYMLDEEKVSLKTVSTLLRHKNVRTTEIYTHTVDVSQLAATDGIKGKFTSKKDNALQG